MGIVVIKSFEVIEIYHTFITLFLYLLHIRKTLLGLRPHLLQQEPQWFQVYCQLYMMGMPPAINRNTYYYIFTSPGPHVFKSGFLMDIQQC